MPACKWTTTKQAGLPEGVGKGYVNVEVTLWLVCTVHTEAQLSRVPTACCKCKDCKKLSKTNNIFVLFHFSNPHNQIHAAALAAAPTPSGQVYPSLRALKALHYTTPAPFPKANKKNHKTWSSAAKCRHKHHHLTVPGISVLPSCFEPHLGFTTQAGYLNHPTDRQVWTREGRILTEQNESALTWTKLWQKYLEAATRSSSSRPRQFMWPPSHCTAKQRITLPLFHFCYDLAKTPQ